MATTTIDNTTTTLGAAAATPAFERTDERVRRAFEAEELRGLKIGTWVRLVVIFTVAVWLPLVTPLQVLWYYYLLMIGFVALSVAPYEIKRRILASVWASYVFTFLDIALLAFAIMVPNPMTHELALPAGL